MGKRQTCFHRANESQKSLKLQDFENFHSLWAFEIFWITVAKPLETQKITETHLAWRPTYCTVPRSPHLPRLVQERSAQGLLDCTPRGPSKCDIRHSAAHTRKVQRRQVATCHCVRQDPCLFLGVAGSRWHTDMCVWDYVSACFALMLIYVYIIYYVYVYIYLHIYVLICIYITCVYIYITFYYRHVCYYRFENSVTTCH